MNPLISIITVTYNAADVVVPTIKSLNDQSFRDFEHIIVDGASSDNTLSIIREIASPETRILSERDNGIYFAMNKGLEMAHGKYVLFLNAGDSLHASDTLALYAEAALESNPDIIYADTVIVDSERRFIAPRHLSVPEVLTVDSFSNGMLVCHQAFMVKLENTVPYDTKYRFSADYDWTIRCMKKSEAVKSVNLHMIAIDYLADGMTDKNHLKSLKERYRIMKEHYGLQTTLSRHFRFIFRALGRKLKSKRVEEEFE